MKSSLFCSVIHRRLVMSYRNFETTYPLPCSRIEQLKIGAIDGAETSVTNYHFTLCNIPVDPSPHLRRGSRLKQHVNLYCHSYRKKDMNMRCHNPEPHAS
jgi:hypothetical protein